MSKYAIGPNAKFDPRFSRGQAGRYRIHVTLPGVDAATPVLPHYDPQVWDQALKARMPGARVVQVRPDNPGSTNPRYRNPAAAYLPEWVPGHDATLLTDLHMIVVVEIPPRGAAPTSRGVGVAPVVVAGVAGLVLAGVAVGFEVWIEATGSDMQNPIFTSVRKVGEVTGDIVSDVAGGAAAGVAKAGLGVLPVVAIAGGALWLLTRSGTRVGVGPVSFGG